VIEEDVQEHSRLVLNTFNSEMFDCLRNVGECISKSFSVGGKIIIFGNGGSAADAQHISAEFISKLSRDRQPLPSLALTVDTSAITAISNDYGYENVFSRQVYGVCDPKDVVIGISTSGHSKSVLFGLKAAADIGAKTIGFTGQNGMQKIDPDFLLSVPSENTARIQEIHIMFGHLICQIAETNYV
jgi:D-sedoheptulose 7-phosphate isomerase